MAIPLKVPGAQQMYDNEKTRMLDRLGLEPHHDDSSMCVLVAKVYIQHLFTRLA